VPSAAEVADRTTVLATWAKKLFGTEMVKVIRYKLQEE
jgi:ferritin-like metal-binding protein YciE